MKVTTHVETMKGEHPIRREQPMERTHEGGNQKNRMCNETEIQTKQYRECVTDHNMPGLQGINDGWYDQ